jgi:hypothetical protein
LNRGPGDYDSLAIPPRYAGNRAKRRALLAPRKTVRNQRVVRTSVWGVILIPDW